MEPYSSDDIKRKKRRYEERKITLDERLNRIIERFGNMVKRIFHLSDEVDRNLYSLQKRLNLLETQSNQLEYTKTTSKKISIYDQPALTPTIKEELPDHPWKTLINEQHDLFDKRNQTRHSGGRTGGMYDATFKIVVFGDTGCGKKTLTKKYLSNLFVSDQTMTIGVDWDVKSLSVDGQKVKLQVWNIGGEGRFRFLLPTYARQARGGLFLYDITNYSSFAHIDDWLNIIRKEIRPEDIFPIIVVGNKADLGEEREVSSAEGIRIAKTRNVNGFIEISMKTGENVEKAFEALTRLMLDDSR